MRNATAGSVPGRAPNSRNPHAALRAVQREEKRLMRCTRDGARRRMVDWESCGCGGRQMTRSGSKLYGCGGDEG